MNIILKLLLTIIGFSLVSLGVFGIMVYGVYLNQEVQGKNNFCTTTYGEGYEYTDASDTPYNLEACVKVNANSSLDIKYIQKGPNE